MGSTLRRSDSREPEHRSDDSGRPAPEIVERRHPNRDVPARKDDVDSEPPAAKLFLVGEPPADENANTPRSGRDRARDAAEAHLMRSGRDERGRRKGRYGKRHL